MKKAGYVLICSFLLLCCGQKVAKVSDDSFNGQQVSASQAPRFNSDSAYSFVAAQVSFGPRVPNSKAHKECAAYLLHELERHGAKVCRQNAVLTAYNGDKLEAVNIIGSYNIENKRRILLFAHWDSRPYADNETDAALQMTPIDGADDGGSGVGVLLEIARVISSNSPNVGIDIIFFDAEDYGTPSFVDEHKSDTWCLGSQFWAKNPHVEGYKAEFGILLDMVGAKNASFYKETTSVRYANRYVERVWTAARNLGFGKFFVNAKGGAVIDDHLYVINGRNIPCLDIINYNNNTDSGFGDHWHTHDDNMSVIDKETLNAVGQTVLDVIFN